MTDRCEEIFPSLSAMIDGEIDDDVRASVEVHLAECATCTERLRRLHALRDEILEMVSDDPPAGFAEQATTWIKNQPAAPSRSFWQSLIDRLRGSR